MDEIRSSGIYVNEVTKIEVQDSNGRIMNPGDTIILRIDTEDILCIFEGIAGGYFITKTREDGIQNRYRVKSIKKSEIVKPASEDAKYKEE